jgi:hypothetical protein
MVEADEERSLMAPRTKPKPAARWRNRIVEHGTLTARDIAKHPKNPRIHPAAQREAMAAMLDDIGWIATIVVNRTTGLLLDGHMRVECSAPDEPLPVTFVEITEDEERRALALMDPLGAMADHDPDTLADLLADTELPDTLAAAVEGLLPGEADDPPDKPEARDLKPLSTAYVLVSIPLDLWDTVSELLDRFDEIPGITVSSTVGG